MRTLLLLTFAFIAGCKGSPAEISGRNGDALTQSPDNEILYAYAYDKGFFGENRKLRAEIERRSWFTADEWERIDAGKFRIGDKEAVVWAAWGKPDDVSKVTTADGTSKVLFYGEHARNRVYIDNGYVTALGQ